jgi:enoyl-CoA hydratase/carnithine racemase
VISSSVRRTRAFKSPFRHIGLAMDGAVGWLLERHVGVTQATKIAYRDRFVSGQEAARLGFALEALLQAEVLVRARDIPAGFEAAPALALSQIKRQFDSGATSRWARRWSSRPRCRR